MPQRPRDECKEVYTAGIRVVNRAAARYVQSLACMEAERSGLELRLFKHQKRYCCVSSEYYAASGRGNEKSQRNENCLSRYIHTTGVATKIQAMKYSIL